ncbi:MAG: DUF3347 domain-containing protein [Chitinophagaceae bacterium]
MKRIILKMALLLVVISACNNKASDAKATADTTTSSVDTRTTAPEPVATGKDSASIQQILDNYLQIKNALTNDNGKAASSAAGELKSSLANFNKTTLAGDQLKMYTEAESEALEHAEHIAANAGNLKHQRFHFSDLSTVIYDLVKEFGNGQQLYYDHCPMFNDGKGADWLSETKQIKNPYYGKAMLSCGTVKETLK